MHLADVDADGVALGDDAARGSGAGFGHFDDADRTDGDDDPWRHRRRPRAGTGPSGVGAAPPRTVVTISLSGEKKRAAERSIGAA